MKKKYISTLIILLCSSATFSANMFFKAASYQVCFTPGQDCTQLVVDTISKAKKSIYIQAYSFTATSIAKALVEARRRGVDVKVILDKSQFKQEKYSSSKFLVNERIPVWIDFKPAIAHNKVMIFDPDTQNAAVITGSFNFTSAAQQRNAENLLVIRDKELANRYLENWHNRQEKSLTIKSYQSKVSRKNSHQNDSLLIGIKKLFK